jgi:transposase-like protein
MQAWPAQLHALPLCASYFCVMLDRLDLRPQGNESPAVNCLHWAVGLLADGELEMLTAWLSPCDDEPPGRQLFAELKHRGVEEIRFCSGPESMRADALAAYPCAKVVPSFGALVGQSLTAVAPSHRRAVRSVLHALFVAPSSQSAHGALDAFAGSALGCRYRELVELWERALVEMTPLYCLGLRHRRRLLIADGHVRNTRLRLRRTLLRQRTSGRCASVSSVVEVALSRVGQRPPRLEQDAVRQVGRTVMGSASARP